MRDAQVDEFKHFSFDLESRRVRPPLWREIAEFIFLRDGGIGERIRP